MHVWIFDKLQDWEDSSVEVYATADQAIADHPAPPGCRWVESRDAEGNAFFCVTGFEKPRRDNWQVYRLPVKG
jgi:hypothetical protein